MRTFATILLLGSAALGIATCTWDWDRFDPSSDGDPGDADTDTDTDADADTDTDTDTDADADADATTTCAEAGGAACGADPEQLCVLPFVEASDTAECCPESRCLNRGGRRIADAARVEGVVNLDGDPEGWPGDRDEISWTEAGSVWASYDDFRARFELQWNEEGLYLLVELHDDAFIPRDPADDAGDLPDCFQSDSVEIFLDLEPDTPELNDTWSDDEIFLVLCTGARQLREAGECSPEAPLGRGWTANVELGAPVAGPDGEDLWYVEAEILWPPWLERREEGLLIGFDIAADDDDTTVAGDLENQLFWNDQGSDTNIDPSRMGLVRLVGPP
jgi:hypothetical protein